jgi:hypothetical protein
MGSKAGVYTKFNQQGQSYVDLAEGDLRYARTPFSEFIGTGVFGQVSSISVAPGGGAPALILFRDSLPGPFSSFDGEFMQFTNASDVTFSIDLAGTLAAFNNTATSMLVLQTQLATEFRISFQDTVVPEWNKFLNETLPSNILKIGNPTVRWVAFPENDQHLNPDRVYVRIKQKIIVVLENWSDYDASFTYWIRFRAQGGNAVASVSKWAYWVEGGIFSGSIGDELEPKVISGATDLATRLNSALGGIPGGVTGVYLLPGKQTTQVGEGFQNVHWSNSRGDATVVVQL